MGILSPGGGRRAGAQACAFGARDASLTQCWPRVPLCSRTPWMSLASVGFANGLCVPGPGWLRGKVRPRRGQMLPPALSGLPPLRGRAPPVRTPRAACTLREPSHRWLRAPPQTLGKACAEACPLSRRCQGAGLWLWLPEAGGMCGSSCPPRPLRPHLECGALLKRLQHVLPADCPGDLSGFPGETSAGPSS